MAVKVRIRKGDNVIVIAGKDKGKTGTISALVSNNERVLIAGVNLVKKHVKPNPQIQQEGGIVTKEASVHISNIMIVNPVTQKRDRIKFKMVDQNGKSKKVRSFASSGDVIDN